MSLSDAGLKNRLEHGVWIDEIERSFRAWREAPNADKPSLLLSGMVLTWAESWRLTHADAFTPAVHTYIARSLSAQSSKTSAEREARDNETRRRDRSYQQILLLMAVFALVVLGPSAVRLYSEHLDRLTGANPRVSEAPTPVTQRTMTAIQIQEPLEETPPPAALQWPPQQLVAQASKDAAAGQRREAVLYALEALDAADRTPADAKPEDRAKALSLIANLHREMRAMPPVGDVAPNAPVHICSPQRFVAQAATGDAMIIDGKAGKAHRIGGVQVTDGSLDSTCDHLLVVGQDYDIKLHAIDPTRRGKTLGTHDAAVAAARFSGDGRRIISVSRDAVGRIWDAVSGKRIASFRSEAQIFVGAALSHDGSLAITWSDDKTAELWDSATGKRRGALVGHSGEIMKAQFSRDGKSILTVSTDGTAMIWASATRERLTTMRPKDSSIVDATLSTDGQTVVARLEEDRVLLWPVEADTATAMIDLGESKLQSLTLSEDSRYLAIVETSGSVGIYGLRGGQKLFVLDAGSDAMIAATFGASGDELTAFTRDSAVHWTLPVTREAAVTLSKAASVCWSAAERNKLKLDPQRPTWCQDANSETGTQPAQ